MNSGEHKIVVPKTARYFVLEPANPKSVLIAIHGYRQLAEFFIKKFEPLVEQGVRVIAPEGLHRFYVNGHSGKVGASWMTKEARLDDIEDYVNFLNLLWDELDFGGLPVDVLGFSQGGPTVSRWMASGHAKARKFILHSSVFPNDFEFDKNKDWLNELELYSLFGDSDEFAPEEIIEQKTQWMAEHGIQPTLIRFHGGHDIHPESLSKVLGI